MIKEWTPADIREESIQQVREISERLAREEEERIELRKLEAAERRKDTFHVNLEVDTSKIDAALEKVKELLRLMDKAGILPDEKED